MLADALGPDLDLRYYETDADRRMISHLNGRATDIRLRIREAFEVHRRVIDWDRLRSPTGIPCRALGLNGATLKLMRWMMRDWKRAQMMNGLPGGTFLARYQMDYRPGRACSAHFMIGWKDAPDPEDRIPAIIRAGMAIQRFRLTATKLGLAIQPSLATLIFGHYGQHGQAFTEDQAIRAKAAELAAALGQLGLGDLDRWLFMGRIGFPSVAQTGPRSIRRPLSELMAGAEGDA